MARIHYLMLSIVAINVALLIFSCSDWDEQGKCVPESTIWSFVKDPGLIDDSNLWEVLFGTTYGLAAIAGSVLIVGSFFFKSDTPLFLGMALSLVYPVYSWIKVFQQIQGISSFGDPASRTIVAILLISPIIIVYLFTLLDWARGRDG